MAKDVTISIVSPVYMSEDTLAKLVSKITQAVNPIVSSHEIVLVDDGSTDGSWNEILEISEENKNVKGIRLSRNFGQHSAITAGLQHTLGKWVVVMDCDLQDSPEEIPNLYNKAKEGYDIVFARRTRRKDSFHKKLLSFLFCKIMNFLTGTTHDSAVANYGIYSRKAINAVCEMRDSHRNFNTMIKWVGFRSASVDVTHFPRPIGVTSYSFSKRIRLAIDTILFFSEKPLIIVAQLGLLISFGSLFVGVYYLYQYLSGRIGVMGYTSIILSLWFLSGVIIFVLGVVGIYVAKTFENVKNRPLYVVDNNIGFEEDWSDIS